SRNGERTSTLFAILIRSTLTSISLVSTRSRSVFKTELKSSLILERYFSFTESMTALLILSAVCFAINLSTSAAEKVEAQCQYRSFDDSSAPSAYRCNGRKRSENRWFRLFGIIFQSGAPIFTRLPANDLLL